MKLLREMVNPPRWAWRDENGRRIGTISFEAGSELQWLATQSGQTRPFKTVEEAKAYLVQQRERNQHANAPRREKAKQRSAREVRAKPDLHSSD